MNEPSREVNNAALIPGPAHLGAQFSFVGARHVLAPAAVALFGRWNWWLPDWAARILRVQPSPLESEAPTQRQS